MKPLDENNEESSFIPSAVSSSAGWHEPKFMCDRQCGKDGFKFYDITSTMVDDDGGPHIVLFCLTCDNTRQEEMKEPATSGRR